MNDYECRYFWIEDVCQGMWAQLINVNGRIVLTETVPFNLDKVLGINSKNESKITHRNN